MVRPVGSELNRLTSGQKVAFRASNGQYVSAEGGGGRELVANRNALGAWETFTINTGRDRNGDGVLDVRELRIVSQFVSQQPVPFGEPVEVRIVVEDSNTLSNVPGTVIIQNRNVGATPIKFPTGDRFSFTFRGRWMGRPPDREFLQPIITVEAFCYDTTLRVVLPFERPEFPSGG